jgi:hypothetical protein
MIGLLTRLAGSVFALCGAIALYWFLSRYSKRLMARALRIQCPSGRHHVPAPGNERKAIFRDDTDRFHFMELLSELGKRFGARVHGYAKASGSHL